MPAIAPSLKGAARKLLAVFLFLTFASTLSAAGTPMGLIQSGTDRALQIVRSSQSGQGPTLRQRRGEILQIVDEYFNFKEMGKRALGKPWKEQPAEKQQEFVKLFKQLLFNTYVDRFETYTGNNEKIVYDEEKLEGEYALVKTRVLGYKNSNVELDYRLHLEEGGNWKVYDVTVEGISLVNNYRQQFSSILANGTFDSLLNTMRQKVEAQEKL